MQSHSTNCKCPDCIASNNIYNYENRVFKTTSQDSNLLNDTQIANLNSNKLFNTQSIVVKHTLPIDMVLGNSGLVFESIPSLVGTKYQNVNFLKALPVVSTVVKTGAGDGTLYAITDQRLAKVDVLNSIQTSKGKVINYDFGKDNGDNYVPKIDLSKLISDNSRSLIEVDTDGLLTVKLDPDGYLEKGTNGLKLSQALIAKIFS